MHLKIDQDFITKCVTISSKADNFIETGENIAPTHATLMVFYGKVL